MNPRDPITPVAANPNPNPEAIPLNSTAETNARVEEFNRLAELKNTVLLKFEGNAEKNLKDIRKYLGIPLFDEEYEKRSIGRNNVGVVNVLTVAGFVGNVLQVECCYDPSHPDKKGLFNSSGNLKKVLQESLVIAKLNAHRFLNPEKVREVADKNVHIHFMQGAVPKNGPSAGISICTAYLSLVMNKPVPFDLSMTGELSLNGEVHKIGGLQAKVTASKAMDMNRIIIPYGNMGDFFELSTLLRDGLTVYFVKHYQDVLKIIFAEGAVDMSSIDVYKQNILYEAKNFKHHTELEDIVITSQKDGDSAPPTSTRGKKGEDGPSINIIPQ